MSIKTKSQRLKTFESKKDTIGTMKGHLYTESTFQNSNHGNSRVNDELSKQLYKAVLNVEKSVGKLKKVCEMTQRNEVLPSNMIKSKDKASQGGNKWLKQMTIAELQKFYMLTHKQSTNDIQKLHKFYKDHFFQQGSSSSSRQSPPCRTNKRKTIQDIKLIQPISPQKTGIIIKKRRGSEALKDHKLLTSNFRETTLKTQMSTRNLKQPFHYSHQKSSVKKQSVSYQRNKLKSILKKPSFQIASKPELKLNIISPRQNKYDSKSKSKLNSGILRSMQSSPLHQKISCRQPPSRPYNPSRSKSKQINKPPGLVFRHKIVHTKKSQSNLQDLLQQINQLSPISNSPLGND